MNAPLIAEVAELAAPAPRARGLTLDRRGRRARSSTSPYAAVRRYAGVAQLPAWLADGRGGGRPRAARRLS